MGDTIFKTAKLIMQEVMKMKNPLDQMSDQTKKKMAITLGAVGGMTAVGVVAAAVWNSKQMRTGRALKRTGRVLYQVGTAMRNVSGIGEM